MKTIQQISKQYGIPKSTLMERVYRLGLQKPYLFDQSTEKLLSKPARYQYKYLVKSPSVKLIQMFYIENPYLSNSEIAQLLAIKETDVIYALEMPFIYESKIKFINNKHYDIPTTI